MPERDASSCLDREWWYILSQLNGPVPKIYPNIQKRLSAPERMRYKGDILASFRFIDYTSVIYI